jgi:hypothetical protein
MSIQYHDPKASPMTPVQPYTLHHSLAGTPTIGLLANGFPDSDTFLEQVETVLMEKMPGATFRHYNKRNASIRVTEEMLGDIVNECDVVLAAYGH